MTTEEHDEARNKYLQCPYLVVKKYFTAETSKMCLEEAYERYIKVADELNDASNGLFNMYKTPTIKNLALNYFYDLT